jgi:hypothetical protein
MAIVTLEVCRRQVQRHLCGRHQMRLAPIVVEHVAGVRYERRVDERGRVVAEHQTFIDPPRGTFIGSAADFMAAKTRGTMTPQEIAGADAYRASQSPLPRPQTSTPAATTEPDQAIPEPPPGLLADIQAVLARASR